jgi:hypothetical protein
MRSALQFIHVRACAALTFLATSLLLTACAGEDRPSPRNPAAASVGRDRDLDRQADAGATSAAQIPSADEAESSAAGAADARAGGERDAGGEDASAAVDPVRCEVTAPTACSDPPLRYADVEPIFAERCASCHGGADGRWPLTQYQHVADWYAEIRGQMLTCGMPPVDSGIQMSRAERERILLWIRCGFPR